MKKILILVLLLILAGSIFVIYTVFSQLSRRDDSRPAISRLSKIPTSAVKVTPQADIYPPVLHAAGEFEKPVPLSGPINTAGAEDSPFISMDGSNFYFFFTPDASVLPERQLTDEVSGIWVSKKTGSGWGEAERVFLQDSDKQSLDGCPAVSGDTLWFCSARTGYTGVNLFTAKWQDNEWKSWQYAGDLLMKDYKVGEVHETAHGLLYFHSGRAGGKGRLDIWVTKKENGSWGAPQNIAAVNSSADDSRPFISSDEKEFWFTRTYRGTPAVYRSKLVNGAWSVPQLIVSQFAGEPTLDAVGNLYFVHHFFSKDGKMIEADIYTATRK